jgi:hypothetical protein
MSELLFVIKCLIITVLLTVAMQVRMGNSTVEQQSQWFLQKSPTSVYIQTVAAGGALALRNIFTSVKNGITGSVESYREGSKAQAGR